MTENSITQTTKRIAFALMIFYGICLLITLASAIYFYSHPATDKLPDDKWLSTFKDGFAFLGGALATIIGYYFGNKNTGEALERAKQEEEKANVLRTELVDANLKNDPIMSGVSPTISESGLITPEKPGENQ